MQRHGKGMRDAQSTRRIMSWALLLAAVLLAGVFALRPAPAQAATTGWWPHFWGERTALPGFWLTGEVVEVAEGSVTLQLPNKHHARGMMRHVSLNVTLDVDDNTLLLTDALDALELSTLTEGDDVVVVPRLVWGNLVAQLIYAGEPQDLADATYRGKLVAVEGDTLTLRNGRAGEFTVLVDDTTVWYDNGPGPRPAELGDNLALRVLGVETENEAGDEVIRAVLITTAK